MKSISYIGCAGIDEPKFEALKQHPIVTKRYQVIVGEVTTRHPEGSITTPVTIATTMSGREIIITPLNFDINFKGESECWAREVVSALHECGFRPWKGYDGYQIN